MSHDTTYDIHNTMICNDKKISSDRDFVDKMPMLWKIGLIVVIGLDVLAVIAMLVLSL